MSINPIIISQNFKIGELDAESYTLLLENCFIDSGYLSKLLNPSDTSSIVIGRTGAGKSALLHMVANKAHKYKKLDPNDISIGFLEHSDLLSFFEELNVHLSMFYNVLCLHILIMDLLKIRHTIQSHSDTTTYISHSLSRLKKDHLQRKALSYFRN